MSKKSRRIIISILAIVSFIVIGSLVWHIFSLNSDKSKLQKKNEGLKKGKNILEINYNEKLKEYANLKITNSKLSAQYVGLNVSYFKLQEENFREQNELMELKRKHKELQSNITELQLNFDKEQRKLMEFQKFKDEFKLISKDNVKNMKNYLKDEKCVSLENIYSANMYFSIFVLLIYISYRIKIQKGILSQKTERSLIRAPLNSFNFNLKCINSRLPIEFYMIKQCEGIDLWKYDENLKIYNPIQMIQHTESGDHSRGEMNERGIYIGAGNDSIDVKIYDMKYYNHENYKIKLFRKFTYSKRATACIFLNTYQAICCFFDGYLRSYDLTNMNSITETIFTQTNSLRVLRSLLYTEDKQNIIAGGNGTIYIVDIEGILKYTHVYQDSSKLSIHPIFQIAEIRPKILITAEISCATLHNISNINNPISSQLLSYNAVLPVTVIALESNSGDFAIGGRNPSSFSTGLGFVHINHLGEDNTTISTIKKINNIQDYGCAIMVIKELQKGTIVYGGSSFCKVICLWKYAHIPNQEPQCWNPQNNDSIYDFTRVPY